MPSSGSTMGNNMRNISIAAILTFSVWALFAGNANRPVVNTSIDAADVIPASGREIAESTPVSSFCPETCVSEANMVVPDCGPGPVGEHGHALAANGPKEAKSVSSVSETDALSAIHVPFLSRLWTLRYRVFRDMETGVDQSTLERDRRQLWNLVGTLLDNQDVEIGKAQGE